MAQNFQYFTDVTGQIWQVGVNASGLLTATAVASIPGVPQAPVVTAIPSLKGSDLIQLAQYNLGGRANAVNNQQMLSFLNEGKDEVWSSLKGLSEKYFVDQTQNTDPTKINYFPALNTTVREYSLPTDFRGLAFIEVKDSGYEFVRFIQMDMTNPIWRNERRGSTANGPGVTVTSASYYYDIIGMNTLIMAEFPEINFNLKLWYLHAIPDIQASTVLSDIVFPFTKKIVDYACMKIMLRADYNAFAAWKEQWRSDLITMMQGATRDQADPQFAQDFMG